MLMRLARSSRDEAMAEDTDLNVRNENATPHHCKPAVLLLGAP